ncbi:alpha-protein kinase vwkA [Ditylenchus destructor]|nr:alpha-protein kinase vwkA [Ditylenchus destructor]
MSSAVKFREASIANELKLLNASRDVQLCFLVDVTWSVETHIDVLRDSICKIVEKLTAGPGAIAEKVSLACVGYPCVYPDLSFTESAEDFRKFLSNVETVSNYDKPEDVLGALKIAIHDLDWSDSMCTKIIFHIADAPRPGEKYHSSEYSTSDRYPDGDKHGRTAENLFNTLREIGIQYHFGKITSNTDKMIELFSEAMGSEILVFDIEDVDKLVDNVISSVSTGISINQAMTVKQHN